MALEILTSEREVKDGRNEFYVWFRDSSVGFVFGDVCCGCIDV